MKKLQIAIAALAAFAASTLFVLSDSQVGPAFLGLIGTVGHKLCFLDSNCTFSGTDTFSTPLASANLKVGAGLQDDGSGNLAVSGGITNYVTATATMVLSNNDCGKWIKGASGFASRITLQPVSPAIKPNCMVWLQPVFNSTASFLLDTNGNNLFIPGGGNHVFDLFPLPATGALGGPKLGFIGLKWNAVAAEWEISNRSSLFYERMYDGDSTQLANGQAYLNYNSVSGNIELLPKDGEGVNIDGQLRGIGPNGINFPTSALTISTTNDVYADNNGAAQVTGAASACAGACIALTTVSMAGTGIIVGSTVRAECDSIHGTEEADNTFDAVVISNTQINLQGVNFVNTFSASPNGHCRLKFLHISTSGPVLSTLNAGILVWSGFDSRTYVGQIDVGGTTSTINGVFSYFNPTYKLNGVPVVDSTGLRYSKAACANLTNGGTACLANTGTSGHVLGFLDGANTYATTQTFTVPPVFTDQTGSRSALGFLFGTVASDITIASQTSLQTATGMAFNIGSSSTEKWYIEGILFLNAANTTMDVKIGFANFPASATALWGITDLGSASINGFGGAATIATPNLLAIETSNISLGSAAGTFGYRFAGVVYGGGTSGSIQMKFAQSTSDVGNLVLKAGSFIRAEKIAN